MQDLCTPWIGDGMTRGRNKHGFLSAAYCKRMLVVTGRHASICCEAHRRKRRVSAAITQ